MVTAAKNKNTAYYINSIICVAIMCFFGLLPSPVETISPLGMRILGIFIGLIYGWIFVDLIWPSFLSFVMLGFTGLMTVNEAFIAGMGSVLYLQLFMLFLVAAYFDKCGLTTYIAEWFVSRKINVGRPWVFTFMLFLCVIVMSCTVGYVAGVLILWTIFYKVCAIYGFKKGDTYVGFIVGGLMYVGVMSTILFPFTSFGIIVQGLVRQGVGTDLALPVGPWLFINTLIVFALIFAYMAFGKFILKIDLSVMKTDSDDFINLREKKMTHKQRVGFIYLIIFMVMLMGGTIFPQPLKGIFANIGVLGTCVLCIVGMVFIRDENGFNKITINDLKVGISWETLILMAATMPLATALESEEAGIVGTIVTWLTQTFAGYSQVVFLIAVIIIFGLLTQVVHNMVLLVIFTPVLCQTCVGLGISPWLFAILITLALQTAVATPAASCQAAMVFANTDWITTKQAYVNSIVFVLFSLIILVVSIPIGMLIF